VTRSYKNGIRYAGKDLSIPGTTGNKADNE